MKRIALGLVVGFALLFCGVGSSYADAVGDYRHGAAAYGQKDYKQAVYWLRKAAEQGDASAQYNLGGMYVKGQGVIKDIVYAYMWWNLASANVDNHAVKNREIAETRMTSAQIAEAQKLARECVRKKYKGC